MHHDHPAMYGYASRSFCNAWICAFKSLHTSSLFELFLEYSSHVLRGSLGDFLVPSTKLFPFFNASKRVVDFSFTDQDVTEYPFVISGIKIKRGGPDSPVQQARSYGPRIMADGPLQQAMAYGAKLSGG